MPLPAKAYFAIEEVEERWSIRRRDTVYYAENGLLELSVRVGEVERVGDAQRTPATGVERPGSLLALTDADAARILRQGAGKVLGGRVGRGPIPDVGLAIRERPSLLTRNGVAHESHDIRRRQELSEHGYLHDASTVQQQIAGPGL